MADSIAGLIKEIKESSKADRSEHAEVVGTLQSIDSNMKTQAETLQKQLAMSTEIMKDNKRKEKLSTRGSKAKPNEDKKSLARRAGEGTVTSSASIIGLPGMMLGNPFAGLAAVGLAFMGFRGWEKDVIKNINKIGSGLKSLVPESITKTIDQKFINTRARILRTFGLNPVLGAKDPDTGKRSLKTPVLQQITNRFSTVRASVLRTFGLGVDGKPISIQDPDGLFTKNTKGKFWASVVDNVGNILRPLKNASQAVTDFAAGAGSKIFEFMKSIGGGAKGFLSVVGKILKPIGFIFSAYDGITAFMDSDKDGMIAKLGDGFGAFLGDFIGAPFDLLKSGVSWILKKFFGVEVDENGNAKEGQGLAGWAVTKLNSFSFEETIGGIVSGLFDVVQKAVDWVGTLFTDPKTALTELWTGLVGEGGLVDILWSPLNFAIDWITKKFGWRDEDAPKFNMLSFLKESLQKATDFMTVKFDELAEWFKSIPDRIRFAAEEFWTNLKADFKIGMIELSDWFKNLPNKLLAAIVNVLSGVSIQLPNNKVTRFFGVDGAGFNLIDPETVAQANAAANAPNPDSSAAISEIMRERERDLADIERRRNEAQEARLRQTQAVAEGDPRGNQIVAPTTVNNGGNSTQQTTNNYYTTTPGSASLDPAM